MKLATLIKGAAILFLPGGLVLLVALVAMRYRSKK